MKAHQNNLSTCLDPQSGQIFWLHQKFGSWVAASMSEPQRRIFLEALTRGHGFEGACRAAGTNPGQAISDRLADPRFRQEWHEADRERLDAAETLLIDQLLSALTAGEGAIADKMLVQLWQALKDERRRLAAADTSRAGTRPTLSGTKGIGNKAGDIRAGDIRAGEASPDDPEAGAERLAALFANVEQRLLEAEALFPG